MSANGCGKSSTAVWQASLVETDLLFKEILRWLQVCVILVFYAGHSIGSGLFDRGLEVRSSSCSFLIAGRGLVGAFTFCAGLSALGLLVFLTIWISSLHILIYVFFVLQLVVSRFGEVWFKFIVSVRSLVCEISDGAFGPRSTSFIGTSCLTRLPKSLFTTAVRSSYEVAGRVVVLDRGIHFPAPIPAPCFVSLTQGTLCFCFCVFLLGLGHTPHPNRFGIDTPSSLALFRFNF